MNFPTVDPYPSTFIPRGQGGFVAALLDTAEPPRIPTPDFDANLTTGLAPLSVGFRDLSTGYPTSWFWEFGDGINSIERNPVHTYTNEGIYTVNLTAGNAMGYATLSRPEYIVVSVLPVPPVADFTANVTTGPAPLAIRFSDNSSNTPTSWSWEFGDGATSTSQNPVHTYLSEGSYTVNLT
ncbi:MAG: PKD domain-containing protein, partial [Methanoregulaceae archaeon]|nr:PKD domain-containing protein [Methanoregulaceae archaeon]